MQQWSPRHRVGRMRPLPLYPQASLTPLPNLRSTTYFGNSTRLHSEFKLGSHLKFLPAQYHSVSFTLGRLLWMI